MKRNVLYVVVLSIIVVLLGTYRLFYSGSPESAENVSEGTNEIRNIRVINKENILVDLEIDYFYKGDAGPALPLAVEYTLVDGKQKFVAPVVAGFVQKGAGTLQYRVNRPMLRPYNVETVRIRATLGDPTKGAVIAERQLDKLISWESMAPEHLRHSLPFMQEQAISAFFNKDYAILDDMFENWKDPAVRTRDGKWKLDALMGLHKNTNYDYPDQMLAKLREWEQHNPDSEGVAIARAMFWVGYAWHARGGGYADSVTEIGWKLFRERMLKAEQVLLASKAYASDNPLWYNVYLKTAQGLSWEKPRILELFTEAIEKEPHFYWNYFQAIISVSPKWGGSYQLMDLVAKAAAEHTSDSDGDVLYTRVYWSIKGSVRRGDDFFKDTLVSWPRMRKGFRELLDDYPDSDWNLNNFVVFACRAGDQDTFLELRPMIAGERFQEKAWKNEYTIESCDRRFMRNT